MIRRTLLVVALIVGMISFFHGIARAQSTREDCFAQYGPNGAQQDQAQLITCLEALPSNIYIDSPDGAITDINSVISFGVTMILIVAGLIAFVYVLLGGIKWITSGGDSGAVEAARGQIIQALIGLIVVLAAWALITLVQEATGACFGIGCTISLPVVNG